MLEMDVDHGPALTSFYTSELHKAIFDPETRLAPGATETAFNSWLTVLYRSRIINRDSQFGDCYPLLSIHTPELLPVDAQAIFEGRRNEFFSDENEADLNEIEPLPEHGREYALMFNLLLNHLFVRRNADGSISLPELHVINGVATIPGVQGNFIHKFRKVSYLDTTQSGVRLRARFFFNVQYNDPVANNSFSWVSFPWAAQTTTPATADTRRIIEHVRDFNDAAALDNDDE